MIIALVKLTSVLESIRDPMNNLLSSTKQLRNSIHQFNGDIQKLFTGVQNTPQYESNVVTGNNTLISNYLNTVDASFKWVGTRSVNSLKMSDDFSSQYSKSISNIAKQSSFVHVSEIMSSVNESIQKHLNGLRDVFQNVFSGIVKSEGNVSTVFNDLLSQYNSKSNIPIKQIQKTQNFPSSPFDHTKNMPANYIDYVNIVVDKMPYISNLSSSSQLNSLLHHSQEESNSMTDTKKLLYHIPTSKSNLSTLNNKQKEYYNSFTSNNKQKEYRNSSTSNNKQMTINIERVDINDGIINNVEDFIIQLQRRI